MENDKHLQKICLGFLCAQLPRLELSQFFTWCQWIDQGTPLSDDVFWAADSPLAMVKQKWQGQCNRLVDIIAKDQVGGILFTYPGAKDFPNQLLTIDGPPFFLTYRGQPVWKEKLGFAVVGSREPSSVTEVWCERELIKVVRQMDLTVVSGGARGVDQIAHRLCLRERKPTIALIPSGLLHIYPQAFAEWVGPIVELGGAVVSEFGPRAEMSKEHFARRNRLISGLSIATLVVEARRRSGTLLTAKHAVDQNKPLFILPSHPLDLTNQGALDLMMEGATPVCDAHDLVHMLSSEAFHHSAVMESQQTYGS